MRFFILFIVAISLFNSCVPPDQIDDTVIKINYRDPIQRQIINLQDRRDVDSLLLYLASSDVTQRYLAARSFATVRSDRSIEILSELLISDPSDEVRLQAAYALGQIGDPRASPILTRAFGAQDSAAYNTTLRAAILEAVGKVGDAKTLELISGISTYSVKEDKLLKGQLRSFYRFAQRGITDVASKSIAIDILSQGEMPQHVRKTAADFVSRYLLTPTQAQLDQLTGLLKTSTDPDIRMGIANAIAKSGNPSTLPVLLNSVVNDQDYRVQTNILRSLSAYDYGQCRDTLMLLLSHSNQHVAELAADVIGKTGDRRDAGELLTFSKSISHPVLKSKVLAAALHPVPFNYLNTRTLINNDLKAGLNEARTPYERAAFIEALARDPANFEVFKTDGLNSAYKVVQTRAIAAIPQLLTNIRTQRMYASPTAIKGFRQLILTELMALIKGGDPGVIAAIASVLKNPDLAFKEDIELVAPFRQAISEMHLPQHIETRYELQDLLGYLQDTSYVRTIPSYNHPIDWGLLDNVSDSSHVFIVTPKGQIKVRLLPSLAPATVANFVHLTQTNYYNGKYIHRVVPNFVVQGGCDRGDGYGGLDYTIRSELGHAHYDGAGYLGMASAGADTEGTQWFITHSATPHLDGRYSIFGRVVEGMEVVHSLQIGDNIQEMRVMKY